MADAVADLVVDFGVNGNSAGCVAEGWSTPENDETWAIDGRSRLLLPTPARAGAGTYVMRLSLRPHVVAGRLPAQRLRVAVNGHPVAAFTLTRRTVRACRIPWSALADRPRMEVVFETPDAAAPAAFAPAADDRRLGVALTRLLLYADAAEPGPPMPQEDQPVPVDIATIMRADQAALQDLMLQFESLGQNCEFGLVQRRCKAEPLGLLRFSSTPLPQLLAALEARFEGMGAPESIHVEPSANGREYMVRDSRFGFLYHAFVATGAMEAADIHRREARRVPFLVRKLLEDLQAGEKTFVFRGMGAMEEEEVFPLAMALRRYGPNTLLFVNLADAAHPAGTLEVRGPGFWVGYLDRFAPADDAGDFELAQWVTLCRAAYRFRLAAGR
jgi:hypothetical protein